MLNSDTCSSFTKLFYLKNLNSHEQLYKKSVECNEKLCLFVFGFSNLFYPLILLSSCLVYPEFLSPFHTLISLTLRAFPSFL